MNVTTNIPTRHERAHKIGEPLSGTHPVRKPRKVDVAYDEIRRMIVALELEPGLPIDERYLVEQLGIGRTPIREAIQRLTHEGLIVHIPRRGSWISSLTFTELQRMIEARRMLEVECARLAAERITPDRLQRLREEVTATRSQVAAGDAQKSVAVDQYFHMEIARATNNRFLVRMNEQLHHELIRYWYVSSMQVGKLDIVVDHHFRILDAIETGDPDVAQAQAEEHIRLFRERLRAMVGDPHPQLLASWPSDQLSSVRLDG